MKNGYQPRISDYDRNGKLSYKAILQILETAGSHHSDTVGDSAIEGSQSGIAWILTERRVQALRRTGSNEKLHVSTWVRGKASASTVFRDFILTDKNGNEVMRVEAKFALLDLFLQVVCPVSVKNCSLPISRKIRPCLTQRHQDSVRLRNLIPNRQ